MPSPPMAVQVQAPSRVEVLKQQNLEQEYRAEQRRHAELMAAQQEAAEAQRRLEELQRISRGVSTVMTLARMFKPEP